jgi:hypothetical protein
MKTMSFEYIRQHYEVPAEIGRRVNVYGKPGIIVQDRGHYIGVNFDADKPGVVRNAHPTSEVEYLGIGKIRKPTRAQERYARYVGVSECFNSFLDFCYYDANQTKGL